MWLEMQRDRQTITQDYLLMHIGKTGGTTIGLTLKALRRRHGALNIKKLRHRYTLDRINRTWPNAKVGFVVREPSRRFISGFNSRLREGRPAHVRAWTARERRVYTRFKSANALAEALSDPALRPEALFAFEAIPHLRRNYKFYLGGIADLKRARDSIYCVIDLEELDEKAQLLFDPAGIDPAEVTRMIRHRHRAPTKQRKETLSDLGRANLEEFWREDFKLYAYCREHLAP